MSDGPAQQLIYLDDEFTSLRQDYQSGELSDSDLADNPQVQLYSWLKHAYTQGVREPNAFNLATVDHTGQPTARIVLLKALRGAELIFFTNYNSRKGKDLDANPKVALTFFYPQLERQIRVQGTAKKTAHQLSANYFAKRSQSSQVASASSRQSQRVENRAEIEAEFAELQKEFGEQPVPCPQSWGGISITPNYYEFWQGRRSRLHDRLTYTLQQSGDWQTDRLYP